MKKTPWVELLKASNTRPIVSKSNKFKSDFFEHKFNASFLKLIQLKGLNLTKKEHQTTVLFAPEIKTFQKSFIYRPFSFGPHKNLGLIVFGPEIIAQFLHGLLGGSPKIAPLPLQNAPTSLEKKTLEDLNGALSLSLREGLKGLLGIHDCVIEKDWDELALTQNLSKSGSYFRETFLYQGTTEQRMDVFLKVESFTPSPS